MFKNLKVGQKLLVIVVLVGAMLGALFLVSYLSFVELRRGLDEAKSEGVPNALLAKDMQMQVVQVQQWLTDISATRGQDGLDDGFKEAEKAYQQFMSDLATIRKSYDKEGNAQGIAQSDQLKEHMTVWYATGKRMAQAYIDGGAPAGNRIMGEFDKVSTQLQAALVPVIDGQIAEANREIAAAAHEAGNVQMFILTGIVVVVVFLTLGGRSLALGVSGPLNAMSGLMATLVARKDFSVELAVRGNDEIAQASRSFNQLVAMLRTMLQELNQDVHRLDDTAKELAAAVATSSSSSSATSQSAASMAAAVEQMSVSLDQMRDNTRTAQAVVGTSTQYSEDGSRVIGAAIDDMKKISTDVQQVAGVIGTLGEQTTSISNIVNVIREVADQTNLLALNAAIEAARAGEQGRGFAVVADEVRKLAERTANATGEISAMIEAIQGSAKTAVTRMSDAVEQADAGARLAEDAGRSIESIRAGAGQVAEVFDEVAHSIAEQSAAGQLIAQQVEQVARASDENSSSVGQTAAAARTLEGLSTEMRRRIDQFKV
ncbi:MAG: methyl-accepting chemotaxis protein [Rhodocyclales bacterium]|nr:methyl-accepting chemotaxis protein [Rhodocyclales bacterium]